MSSCGTHFRATAPVVIGYGFSAAAESRVLVLPFAAITIAHALAFYLSFGIPASAMHPYEEFGLEEAAELQRGNGEGGEMRTAASAVSLVSESADLLKAPSPEPKRGRTEVPYS